MAESTPGFDHHTAAGAVDLSVKLAGGQINKVAAVELMYFTEGWVIAVGAMMARSTSSGIGMRVLAPLILSRSRLCWMSTRVRSRSGGGRGRVIAFSSHTRASFVLYHLSKFEEVAEFMSTAVFIRP
ncbi:MAG: hypothetical protein FWD57_02250 [Polyangiaceae bacterium]|nr:hypothetical protein [Polyangiaceae bacterium]